MIRIAILFTALALAGCGKPAEPTKADGPKGGGDTTAPVSPAGTNQPVGGPNLPTMPGPSNLTPNDASQALAVQFIQDLRMASEKPEPLHSDFLARLSPAFLKVIGKPLRSDDDRKLGYSASEASAWLKNLGTKLVGIGLPIGYGSPAVAVLSGTIGNGSGRFLVRMTFGEGWKVDWLSLGTIAVPPAKPDSTESTYQDFAALAFLDALTGSAASKDERVKLLGGIASAKLKAAWAEAFAQDKALGLDYNAGKLGLRLDELGGGVTDFTRTSTGGDAFTVQLMKSKAGTKYTLKLVKGATPGEWLVDEFTKQ